MPAEPVFEIGDKVIGSGTFRGLKGKVIDTSETGFGLRFALVEEKDGTKISARTIYLTKKKKN